jgi:Tfp pilus assembly protein PilV
VTARGYATDAEWLAATPGGIVQTVGRCGLGVRHDAHTFTTNVWPTHTSGWHCWGQLAECGNCDERKCMDCVLRVWHEECAYDCPDCCPATTTMDGE